MPKKLKFAIYIFAFLAVALIGANFALGERIKFNELPGTVIDAILGIIKQNPPKSNEPTQTYDLLIKKAQTGTGAGAYQEGDIVAIKPLGHEWSSGEIQNFWIAQMELTETQAEELMKPKEKETGEKDESGLSVMEMEARRKYFIDINILSRMEKGEELGMKDVGER
ncbi:hypothetical protein KJ586_03940 [Patescibacteria group bacterium]|nr:hypothetical protein [Patescibacteria group bacterium]MBU4455633.1 hypothetical protein [Patescibacteria group bacterium]MCG2690893.1 hypothetical protein [Candidatus Parcubacteria bacterium]